MNWRTGIFWLPTQFTSATFLGLMSSGLSYLCHDKEEVHHHLVVQVVGQYVDDVVGVAVVVAGYPVDFL